jgi:hypothetical protein
MKPHRLAVRFGTERHAEYDMQHDEGRRNKRNAIIAQPRILYL